MRYITFTLLFKYEQGLIVRTNNIGDSKRANGFRNKLIPDRTERNILRSKPHFLTNDVDGRI